MRAGWGVEKSRVQRGIPSVFRSSNDWRAPSTRSGELQRGAEGTDRMVLNVDANMTKCRYPKDYI